MSFISEHITVVHVGNKPTPTKLNLTIRGAESVRSVASPVTSEDCQKMLSLFDGHTVEANVYSGTNKCFDVTEQMIRDAWNKLNKDKFWWVTAKDVEHLVERFTIPNEFGNTLAMTLPNLFCEETPAEIEIMLAN